MAQALAANRTIEAAEARLAQSEALVSARRAERGPSASAEARYARTRPAIAAFGVEVPGFEPQDIDLFDVGLRASWELDLAGGRRRSLQSAIAGTEAAGAALDDVRLSVLNETAQAYVALREAQQEQVLAEGDLAAADRLVELVAEQRRLGVASDLDTRRSAAERARVAATLPALEADAEAALARLAVLTGKERGALDTDLLGHGVIPTAARTTFPAEPAAVIRQRPISAQPNAALLQRPPKSVSRPPICSPGSACSAISASRRTHPTRLVRTASPIRSVHC
nr:TolC family protein [Qipengyuania qiaonensis]